MKIAICSFESLGHLKKILGDIINRSKNIEYEYKRTSLHLFLYLSVNF